MSKFSSSKAKEKPAPSAFWSQSILSLYFTESKTWLAGLEKYIFSPSLFKLPYSHWKTWKPLPLTCISAKFNALSPLLFPDFCILTYLPDTFTGIWKIVSPEVLPNWWVNVALLNAALKLVLFGNGWSETSKYALDKRFVQQLSVLFQTITSEIFVLAANSTSNHWLALLPVVCATELFE